MLHPNFVILGIIIGSIGTLSYVIDTLKGKAKPNRVTWFLWSLAPLIAFVAEVQKGVGIQSLMTFSVGFTPLCVFIASFINKKSEWKITKLDLVCGALSLVGLLLWYLSNNASVAIIFAIIADALAAFPTVIKAFHFPETENYHAYVGAGINGLLTTLTLTHWDIAHAGFPIYILLINLVMAVLIIFKVKKYFT